ncbi:uncharacterized protein MELLADRAFT_92953 [Melampsora larici-populina 98AG31]|uniref:G domain-containing protein n=1 Tax=Melampsora larici-populina (strain 98AG31 / pathotype 3-4-7) TaxID=747676 RepID=F4S3C7_MELLP|nr:uncharacterized protein MELLADRAFT_92953 [Melampsora larici-populina 98AG31]EGG00861.1 hypothetical protein MELLADRAFT_92953 [Melampsora larici-populina 98AG31]
MAQNGIQNHMTEHLQVIGEEQTFTTDLSSSIKNWGLLKKGFNYDLAAVFGSKSSGKSNLLNHVFGTTFEVMDEAGWRQTTKEHEVGIYQGANMRLLKTVFEVDLALFQANKAKQKQNPPSNSDHDKTNLIFVIRDPFGVTPLSYLEKTITGDLNRIWDGLADVLVPELFGSSIRTHPPCTHLFARFSARRYQKLPDYRLL